MKNEIMTIDRNYIISRLSNWKDRLQNLFSDIKNWSEMIEGNIAIKEFDIPQAREELMSKFDVKPETIHKLVLSNNTFRASFVPMGLWVMGSNGRVNITTQKDQYILVDLGEDSTPKWTIVNPAKRKEQVDFTQETLKKIIDGEEIF